MDLVIDSNILVSGLRSSLGASHAVLQRIRFDERLRLHVSTPVVLEYEEVLIRELVPSHFTADQISSFLDDLIARSIRHASIVRRRPISPDPDDDALIELALTSGADALITHNLSDFTAINQLGVALLTPGELLRLLKP